jgi:hypothetical protein
VLRAEGMEPLIIEGIGLSKSEYFKLIHGAFVKHFGAAVCVRDFE